MITESKSAPPEPQPNNALWALKKLPPFPAVATKLLQVVSKENVDLAEIGRLISSEPVLSTEVLQVANSALFGLSCQVKSIAQAILILGLDRIKGITLTRAFGSYLKPAMRLEALRRCWQHSIAGAVLAEMLGHCCQIDADMAYTAGLLRDIGRLALLVKYPAPFANLLAVSQENGFDVMAAERDLFDVDHCEAGAWLLAKMPLPLELADAIAHHHADLNGQPFGLVHVVQVADRLSEAFGFGLFAGVEPQESEVTEALALLPEPARIRCDIDPASTREDIATRIAVLGNA